MLRISAALLVIALFQVPSLVLTASDEDAECPSAEQPAQEHLLLQVNTPGSRTKPALADIPSLWRTSGETSGDGLWCKAFAPSSDFSLKKCSADGGNGFSVKVLTYNLFWWNLFGPEFRNGNGGSAGKLIAEKGSGMHYDFMGFQECEDINRVLLDAGLTETYGSVYAAHSIAIAYRMSSWVLVDRGMEEIAEDRPEQWWGTRGAVWARFRHASNGKTVFFINHHGPLPVGTGGRCGTRATAWNILRTIGQHAQEGDGIILAGDFNADASSRTVQELERRLHRVSTGVSFGGVDHIFSNCDSTYISDSRNLGKGGSDHDALDLVIKM